jgi:DNA mismatch repair protein MutS
MPFQSILFERPEDFAGGDRREAPSFLADLNLDQVMASMAFGRDEYNLTPYFLAPLPTVSAVEYRHQVLLDLEKEDVRGAVTGYARDLSQMRKYLAVIGKLHYRYQRERWFLDAVDVYCRATKSLAERIGRLELRSPGFTGFREHLNRYVASGDFTRLADEAGELLARLAEVRYCLHIRGGRVRISKHAGEEDYGADVEKTFANFKHGAVKDYRVGFRAVADMDHVEAQVLDLVGKLYPESFAALDDFCARHAHYVDDTLGAFDREVQFYLAYLDYIRPIKAVGLDFCYPQVSETSKELTAGNAFDIALAAKLARDRSAVVGNSFWLAGPERVLIVTGPNQGGKTTFARMFGQLHHLASLGLPVPGREARLFLPDRIFTHFEKEEDLQNLRGKLQDELIRIREILAGATSRSVIVMNESFGSTTAEDALFLGSEILRRITDLDLLGEYVTFIDELASLNEACVSMVATIVPDDPADRTFKVVRRPADGLAYAAAIAGKYGLTYQRLKDRIAS